MFLESLIVLPVLALVVFIVPVKWKWFTSLCIIMLGVAAATAEATIVLMHNDQYLYTEGTNIVFGEQYGITDPLSATFIMILSIVVFAMSFYARGYLKPKLASKAPVQISLHYFCLMVMYFSMLLVVSARDGFMFLFAWELMTLSSFFLVLFDGEQQKVRRAALNYLIMMHVGFIFLLIGFVMLYTEGLPVTFDSLGVYFERQNALPIFIMFLVGFGMKAGMFPLHSWLPEAHPVAPPHVSAIMSGVMVKMGVYGIIRVTSYLTTELYTVGLIILIAGGVTGLWGVIFANLQNNMKKLLAYSTMENVGIIFMGLGIGLLGKSTHNYTLALCGFAGAILHTVNHSFFKSMLYMGAGNVTVATHATSLDQMGGLSKRMPITAVMFLIGCLALCAVPALNGFVSEFLVYTAFFDGISGGSDLTYESLFGLIFLALIGGLVIMAIAKLYGIAFLGQPRTEAAIKAKEVDQWMLVAMAIPLAGIITIGLVPILFLPELFEVAGMTMGIENAHIYYGMVGESYKTFETVTLVLIGVCLTIWAVRSRVLRKRPESISPTWGCGFTAITPKMQYSGESFTEGLERVSESVLKKSGHTVDLDAGEIFPYKHDFDVTRKDKIDQYFAIGWLAVLRRVNARMAFMGTGKINHYILYAMLFFMIIFILSLFNWIG